jgi:DNA adenine methylase
MARVVERRRTEPLNETRDVDGTSAAVAPLRPPLKWAGGKRWQVPHLRSTWAAHSHRRLLEPFCGGLGVALGLRPDRALLNDVNPHLINFYQWLKRGLTIDVAMANDSKTYYRNRDRFNHLLSSGAADSSESAGLFYYLNRTGYNGLCRFNRQGGFNVPFGRYKTIEYRVGFDEYVTAFERFEFANLDFESVPVEPTDFIYADPPYDVEFRSYSQGGFDWDAQVRAAEWLARHPGPVILSNQATDRIVKLYRRLGFELSYLTAPRLISCTGDRTPAKEVLASRNL